MEVASLDDCYDEIDQCYFLNATNNINASKSGCLSVIKELTRLLKLYPAEAKELSSFALKLYETIAAHNDRSFLSANDKLLWLSSRVNDDFFPPNHDRLFHLRRPLQNRTNDDLITLPAQIPAKFQRFDLDNWSVNQLQALYQDLLSNCSFVSSFLAAIQSGQTIPLLQLIAPHIPGSNYLVSLNFNGCRRLVRVDNQFPVVEGNPSRKLVISSSHDPDLMWPALVEKAFLKVMGNGYNFQGSNMALDTFMLVGWVPEVQKLNNGRLPDNFSLLWASRVLGVASLGLGTGKLSNELATKFNLISNHDYMIYGFNERYKTITLKNPWVENNDQEKRLVEIDHLRSNFLTYFYINWDVSKIFKFTHQVNFVFPKLDPISYQWFKKPQYFLKHECPCSMEVWILLEKHIPSKSDSDSIKLEVFQTTSGEKVMVPNQYLLVDETEYTNSRMVLLKVHLEPSKSYTVVITGPSLSSFSLSMFNSVSEDFKLTKSKALYSQLLPVIEDSWVGAKNGGNWALTSFLKNPQYELEIKNNPANLQMILISDNPDKQVNFHLFYSEVRGKAVRNFDKSKLLFNENYTPEFHFHAIQDLKPGVYKLILSSYNKEVEGNFTLLTYHDSSGDNVKITPLSTSLGLFINSKEFLWNNLNRKKLYFQTEYFITSITFRLRFRNNRDSSQDSATDYRPGMRGSVFNAETQEAVQINEKWNDCPFGVYVDCVLLNPGSYILLIERFEAGTGYCTVDVGSDKRADIKYIL